MDIKFKSIAGGFMTHRLNISNNVETNLHYHDAYELYYLLDGKRNYFTQSKIYPLNADWVTLTGPYIIHGTNGQKYERLLINFTEDFLNTYFQPALIDVFHEVFSVEAIPAEIVKSNPRIKELFYLILQESKQGNMKMVALHLGILLMELYEAIKQVSPETDNSTLPTKMQEILAYISNNVDTIHSLEQVSNHFYVSKYYLSHQFKDSTGFTFIEFLTKVKLSRALYLLKHTNDSITKISEACGFETPTYFGVVFKKKMDMTPLQYRAWINEQTT